MGVCRVNTKQKILCTRAAKIYKKNHSKMYIIRFDFLINQQTNNSLSHSYVRYNWLQIINDIYKKNINCEIIYIYIYMGLTIVLEVQTTCSVYDCVWKYSLLYLFLISLFKFGFFDNVNISTKKTIWSLISYMADEIYLEMNEWIQHQKNQIN